MKPSFLATLQSVHAALRASGQAPAAMAALDGHVAAAGALLATARAATPHLRSLAQLAAPLLRPTHGQLPDPPGPEDLAVDGRGDIRDAAGRVVGYVRLPSGR